MNMYNVRVKKLRLKITLIRFVHHIGALYYLYAYLYALLMLAEAATHFVTSNH